MNSSLGHELLLLEIMSTHERTDVGGMYMLDKQNRQQLDLFFMKTKCYSLWKIFSIALFIYVQNPTSIHGQNVKQLISKIDSLTKEKRQIEKKIQKYRNLKDQINLDLLKLFEAKFQLELRKGLNDGVETTTRAEGSLRDQPSLIGTEIIRIPAASKITVFDWYQEPYFKVSYKDKVGYLNYGYIKLTKLLEAIPGKQSPRKDYSRKPKVTSNAKHLSPLALAWAKRLRIEFGDRNPTTIRQTLEAIRNRYELKKITTGDYKILSRACKVAINGRWNEAMKILGLDQLGKVSGGKKPTSGNILSLRVGGSVSTRGIKIPLPNGASISNYTPGRSRWDDDVWRITMADGIEGIIEFYASELKRLGWYPDQFMKNCWIKPRPSSTINEIVCVQIQDKKTYEIRLAP